MLSIYLHSHRCICNVIALFAWFLMCLHICQYICIISIIIDIFAMLCYFDVFSLLSIYILIDIFAFLSGLSCLHFQLYRSICIVIGVFFTFIELRAFLSISFNFIGLYWFLSIYLHYYRYFFHFYLYKFIYIYWQYFSYLFVDIFEFSLILSNFSCTAFVIHLWLSIILSL